MLVFLFSLHILIYMNEFILLSVVGQCVIVDSVVAGNLMN